MGSQDREGVPMINISLDGNSFSRLVRGEAVKFGGVEIILSDIGFSNMRECIDNAERNAHDADDARDNPPERKRYTEG